MAEVDEQGRAQSPVRGSVPDESPFTLVTTYSGGHTVSKPAKADSIRVGHKRSRIRSGGTTWHEKGVERGRRSNGEAVDFRVAPLGTIPQRRTVARQHPD